MTLVTGLIISHCFVILLSDCQGPIPSQHIPQDCKGEPICSGSTSFLLLCYFDFNFPFGQEHLPAGEEEERVEKSATVFLHFSLISLLSLELNWQLSDYTPGTALSSLYCVHVLNPYNTPARKVYILPLFSRWGNRHREVK